MAMNPIIGYTQVIDQSASGCISSSFKINAWSHYGWHIRHQTIVPQISCVEGVSGEYCWVVSACMISPQKWYRVAV
jgi:hypothetical protein